MFGQLTARVLLAALLLLPASRVDAIINTSNPRAMGMGGAYTALARGSDAPTWNPANLGLSDRPHVSLTVVDLGLGMEMDGLSTETMNDISGKFLTAQDKDDILAELDEGMKLDFDAEVKLLSLSISTFALNVNALAGGNLTLPQDLFDFLLNGNELDKPIEFSQADGQGMGVISTGLSGAMELDVEPFQEFSVGAGLKHYYGVVSALVSNSGGEFVSTLDEGMQGHGFLTTRRATGGSGMGVDLGVAGVLENDVIFSLGIINLLGGKINWENNTEADSIYFRLTAHYLDEMIDSDEDIVESSDTTYAVGSFSTQMPRIIHAGVARQWRKLTVAFDLEKASVRSLGYDPAIRLAAGAEFRYLPLLPFRLGASIGGVDGQSSSFGFGLHLLGFQWDLAFRNRGSFLPTSSDGIGLATGVRFAW